MLNRKLVVQIVILATLTLIATGCDDDENKRLAEMAERHLERQAQQNQQMSELQHEVAQGSRQLVQADAEARKELIALQREVQGERKEVGRQRDQLEQERRELAASRYIDPIIAAAITNVGLVMACLLPLIICWYLLHRGAQPADDQAVAELLLDDLVSDNPMLAPPTSSTPAIGPPQDQVPRLADPEPTDD